MPCTASNSPTPKPCADPCLAELLPPPNRIEIAAEGEVSIHSASAPVSPLPSLFSPLRSLRDSLLAISCSLCTANPRRTLQEPRRPPSFVASVPEPLLDFVLALGKIAVSYSISPCLLFVESYSKSTDFLTPVRSGHGAAAGRPNSGRPLPSLFPDLILTVRLKSDGSNQNIPLRP